MSDEFLRVATQEINEELTHIETILNSCNSDSDVSKRCEDIESHYHKIKGLTPMMGKKDIGKISELIDSILKNILSGKNVVGIYDILVTSNDFMKNDMNGKGSGYEDLESKINTNYSEFLE